MELIEVVFGNVKELLFAYENQFHAIDVTFSFVKNKCHIFQVNIIFYALLSPLPL